MQGGLRNHDEKKCVIASVDPGLLSPAEFSSAIKTDNIFFRSMREKGQYGQISIEITTLALNILSTNSSIRASGVYVPKMKPCILCKREFISHPDEPIKEFTMATCGCLYHQKCLEGYLLNIVKNRANLTCPNWDCKVREIETLIRSF